MKIDLAALDPAPTAMVANLPYSVATPLILRTIEELPSLRALDGDGPARDRRPAAGGAGQPRPTARPSVARPARLRGRAGAHGRPGRVQAAAAGRLGDPAAAPHAARAPTRRPATWSAPPSPTAASRWRARWSIADARAAARRSARRSWSSACPETPAPRRSRRASSPPCPRRCSPGLTPDPSDRDSRCSSTPPPSSTSASTSAARRDDGLHELCSLFEPLALADLIAVDEAERDEVVCPGVEGENLAARGAGGAARAGLGRAAAADRDREADPGRRRARRRQRRRRRGRCGWPRGEVDRPAEPDRRRARRRRPLAAAPGPGPGRGRGREGRAAARPRPSTRSSCCPTAAASRPPRSSPRPTGSASAASEAELDELAARLRAGGRRRRLAARLRRAAGQRPRAGGASRCGPRSARRSTPCARPARRVAFLTGSGPTAFGLFADLAAAERAAASARPRRRDRLRRPGPAP